MRPVARLVLVTPYDSVAAIASRRFWFLPVRWLLLDTFDSLRYAPAVTAPTTILAADHDTVIPLAHTERLLASFHAGVATMTVLANCGHDSISSQPGYSALLGGAAAAPRQGAARQGTKPEARLSETMCSSRVVGGVKMTW